MGLIDIAIEKQAKLAPAFIDDVTFLAGGKNFSITHAKIHSMMTRPSGAYECVDVFDETTDRTLG